MPEIISRDDARRLGLSRYFNGQPCKRGHICERHVSSNQCLGCKVMPPRDAVVVSDGSYLSTKPCPKGHVGKRLLRNKNCYQCHRERVKAAYHSDPKRFHAYVQKYRKRFPEADGARRVNRRARISSSGGKHTGEDRKAVLELQKFRCANCRKSLRRAKVHIDHKMPLALGGRNDRSNLEALCSRCNCRKGAKHPTAWALENGRLL